MINENLVEQTGHEMNIFPNQEMFFPESSSIQFETASSINIISLSTLTEEELWVLKEEGNREAFVCLYNLYGKYLRKFVEKKYSKYFIRNSSIKEDLVQEAQIGMIKAIERYNPSYNVLFITYLTFWVKESVLKFINENLRTVKFGRRMNDTLYQYLRFFNQYYAQNGFSPSDEVICENLSINMDYLIQVKVAEVFYTSCEVYDENDNAFDNVINSSTLFSGDSLGLSAFYEYENFECKSKFFTDFKEYFFKTYPSKEKERDFEIFLHRFPLLENYEQLLLIEVGEKFGISSERVRQIEAKCLQFLKRNPRLMNLLIESVE